VHPSGREVRSQPIHEQRLRGLLAGIVVLSKDIIAISEEEIPSAYVVYTILGRAVVYNRPTTDN
jgi:hypothetical protein